ncbi:hypothetical protein AVEN_217124-1 [Araneus ventricosus]|uniref:Uncharacterized protein n=1 Tax=Araneus ventricosus TaxID=182803 RepID=A0A4Y2E9V4_ARAVE|nr:hypothetical protein AVEN_217124-1 [Araneus ventricosus]
MWHLRSAGDMLRRQVQNEVRGDDLFMLDAFRLYSFLPPRVGYDSMFHGEAGGVHLWDEVSMLRLWWLMVWLICVVSGHRQLSKIRRGYLRCRTGVTLEVHPDGVINGTKEKAGKFASLLMMSFEEDARKVAFFGVHSKFYVCMDPGGKLYGKVGRAFVAIIISTSGMGRAFVAIIISLSGVGRAFVAIIISPSGVGRAFVAIIISTSGVGRAFVVIIISPFGVG